MIQLTNFIPKTTAECRALLITLRDNPEGTNISDRYGNPAALEGKECQQLARLIESQIGEKTPAAPKKDTAKKSTTKSATKK